MKIIEKGKNLVNGIKDIYNGTKLVELNKNIELMTLKEISNELKVKLLSINDINEIDSRTEELLKYTFKVNHGKNVDYTIKYIFDLLKKDELKIDFIEKFANEFEEDSLMELSKGIQFEKTKDKKLLAEENANKAKRIINGIVRRIYRKRANERNTARIRGRTYRHDLLKLKFEQQNRYDKENIDFNDKILAKIYAKNYEKINIYDVIKKFHKDLIIDIYNELPEEIKNTFYLEYYIENSYYIKDEDKNKIVSFLVETIPEKQLKMKIIGNEFDENLQKELLKTITINYEDIQDFYRSNGVFPKLDRGSIFDEDSLDDLDVKCNIKTAEEIINELKYFKNDYEKSKFLYFIFKNDIPNEELKKLIQIDEISSSNKERIYNELIYNSDYMEKLTLFKNMNSQQKSELMHTFIYEAEEINEEQKDFYIKEILDNIDDLKIKNDYKMFFTTDFNEMFEILKSGEYTFDNYSNKAYSSELLLKFSDEQLKELFEVTKDTALKPILLKLSRRKKEDIWGQESEEDEKQREEYNKQFPEYILVNKDNFFERIIDLDEENIPLLLYSFEEYSKELSFEEKLSIYDKIRNQKPPHWCKRLLFGNITLEENLKLLNMDFTAEELIDILCESGASRKVTINEISKYIDYIFNEKEKEVKLKEETLKRIEDIYLYGDINADKNARLGELENKYREILNNENTDINNKYFCLSVLMKKIQYYHPSEGEDRIYREFNDIFKNINNEAGKPEYTIIFGLEPEYIETNWDRNSNVKNYINIADCMKYFNSDIVYEKVKELYSQNHNIAGNISPAMLKENVIGQMDNDVFEFISRYGVDGSDFEKVFEDEAKSDLFINAYSRLKQFKSYPEEDARIIASFIDEMSQEDMENIDIENNDSIEVLLTIALNKNLTDIFKGIKEERKERGYSHIIDNEETKGKDTSIFEQCIESSKEEARKKISRKLLTTTQALDAIGERFFNLSYEQMRHLTNKYSSDVVELIKKYEEKANNGILDLEEQNELKSLKVLRNIKEIISLKDKQAIVDTFNELDQLPEFENPDYFLSNILEENVKRVYAKNYKENIYTLNEKDKLSDKVDGIEVYSPEEFNMFVHVVAAYGDFKLIDKEHPENSAKNNWEGIDNKKNHILCTSFIGNSNLCYARHMENMKALEDKRNVIFGFSNFSPNSVLMSAPYDLGSDTDNIASDRSYYESDFRTAKNLLNNTRWYHNEVCLERRLENQKDLNIEPDYIVCVDEINEESKKVAKDFEIPIVLINTKEIAQRESVKLNGLVNEFCRNKDASLIPEILNLYQTNMNSFSNFRSELVEQFFNPNNMNENVDKMIKIIDSEYYNGNKSNAAICYKAMKDFFKKEIEINIASGIDPEDNSKYRFKIREYAYLMREKANKTKIYLNDPNQNLDIQYSENAREAKLYGVINKNKEKNQNEGR